MWGKKEDYIDTPIEKFNKQQTSNQQKKQTRENKIKLRNEIQLNEIQLKKQQIYEKQLPKIDEAVQGMQFSPFIKKKKRKSLMLLDDIKDISINNELSNKLLRSKSQSKSKQMEQNYKKNAIKLVIKWSKQRVELERKRIAENNKRQQIQRLLEIKANQQEEKNAQFLKIEKRKIIQMRLKQQQQRRLKKKDIVKNSATSEELPRYQTIEKNYLRKERQQSFQEQIVRKNYKKSMIINLQSLKEHEKAYIERIKDRLNMKKQSKKQQKDKQKVKSEFDLYLNRKQQKIKEQQLKLKRRQKFQQKISRILISVDQSKKIEREIAIDKSKNPHKYNFLSQKSLNDHQIYKQFPNFNINIDSKQIGKGYLQKLKQEPRLRLSRSTAIQRSDIIISDRPHYANYLQQIKIRKSVEEKPEEGPIYKKYQSQQKKEIKNIPLKKIDKYSQQTRNLTQKDQNYLKSIKDRLRILQKK